MKILNKLWYYIFEYEIKTTLYEIILVYTIATLIKEFIVYFLL